jgi:DNA mismatch repair protein MLH1
MEDDEADDPEAWKAEAQITNANYQAKKMIFLLFINRKSLPLHIPPSD